MSKAQEIVAVLLEDVRICAGCQKEFGIAPQRGESHGVCRRHALEYYGADMKDMIDQMPPDNFPPDMAQQRPA